MMRTLLPLAFLAMLFAAAPPAAAQDANESEKTNETPRDGGNAWVEDCPPDRMCAFGGGAADSRGGYDCSTPENETREECYVDPGAPQGECMDGSRCDMSDCPDCRTLTGDDTAGEADPIRAPVEGAEGEAGVTSADDNEVPGFAVAGVLVTLGLLGVALRRR